MKAHKPASTAPSGAPSPLVKSSQTESTHAAKAATGVPVATTEAEVDTLVTTLRAIAAGDYDGFYERDQRGGYQPLDWDWAPASLFQIATAPATDGTALLDNLA